MAPYINLSSVTKFIIVILQSTRSMFILIAYVRPKLIFNLTAKHINLLFRFLINLMTLFTSQAYAVTSIVSLLHVYHHHFRNGQSLQPVQDSHSTTSLLTYIHTKSTHVGIKDLLSNNKLLED